MAPNDSFRNGALQYNLLEEIIEREEFNFQPDFIAVDWVPVRPTVRITENVFMVLNILPPDFERCLLIRAEESLASNELLPYVDPQPSNLSLEEARLLIANFISQGLIFSTEAIDNRQFIEERFTELLICYGEGRLQPAHDGLVQFE
jgi:hypothetical protein